MAYAFWPMPYGLRRTSYDLSPVAYVAYALSPVPYGSMPCPIASITISCPYRPVTFWQYPTCPGGLVARFRIRHRP